MKITVDVPAGFKIHKVPPKVNRYAGIVGILAFFEGGMLHLVATDGRILSRVELPTQEAPGTPVDAYAGQWSLPVEVWAAVLKQATTVTPARAIFHAPDKGKLRLEVPHRKGGGADSFDLEPMPEKDFPQYKAVLPPAEAPKGCHTVHIGVNPRLLLTLFEAMTAREDEPGAMLTLHVDPDGTVRRPVAVRAQDSDKLLGSFIPSALDEAADAQPAGIIMPVVDPR